MPDCCLKVHRDRVPYTRTDLHEEAHPQELTIFCLVTVDTIDFGENLKPLLLARR